MITLHKAVWFGQALTSVQRALWSLAMASALLGLVLLAAAGVAQLLSDEALRVGLSRAAGAAFVAGIAQLVLRFAVILVDEIANALALEHINLSADDGKERGNDD
jgi:hypothetical protein